MRKKKYRIKKLDMWLDIFIIVAIFGVVFITSQPNPKVSTGDALIIMSIWIFMGMYQIQHWNWYEKVN